MLASPGSNWFDRQRQEPTWASIVVSFGVTAALFASAFTAMRTVGALRDSSVSLERPEVVRLQPPAPEKSKPQPTSKVVAPVPVAPRSTPTAINTPSASPTIVAPVTTAAPPAPTDTTSRARAKPANQSSPGSATPIIPLGPIRLPSGLADTLMSIRGGAPNAGAGVSLGDRTPNTARVRDSIAQSKMNAATYSAWMAHKPTGKEKAEMEASQRAGAALAARTTSAGSHEVHSMQGEGRNGEGAVGGAGGSATSLSLPLFSKGPSDAQRRANAKVDADYQMRLRRLQDLILLRNDSAHTDSLRRDSLARLKRP